MDAQEIFAIVNPVAGGGRGYRAWRAIRPALRTAGRSVEEAVAQHERQAWELAEQAARDGRDIVLAVGGDGTIHEVLNGLLRGHPERPPALAVIPGGTANIFVRALGLPRDPDAAARLLLSGSRRRIDVGQVNDRYYATIAGVGFDAEVVYRARRWPRWLGGKVRHVGAALGTLAFYRPVAARVRIDGQEQVVPLYFLAAANTNWYGIGINVAPHARVDDGRLSVVYVTDVGRLEIFRVLLQTFSGRHLGHRKVGHAFAREIHVESDVLLPVHADGEPVGRTPARFRCVPGALEVIVPPLAPPSG